MKNAKKAVRKAAVARKKAEAAKVARAKRVAVDLTVAKEFLPAMKPLVLYKYMPPGLDGIVQVMVDRKIRFTNPVHFDDPFDCRMNPVEIINEIESSTRQQVEERLRDSGQSNEIPRFREVIAPGMHKALAPYFLRFAKAVARMAGVCCFTKNPRSLPMWAHYANSHEGVCLEFRIPHWACLGADNAINAIDLGLESGIVANPYMGSFPFSITGPVSYVKGFSSRSMEDMDKTAFWARPYFEKSNQWRNEEEWRAIIPNASRFFKNKKPEDIPIGLRALRKFRGPGVYPLGKNRITKVILGARAKPAFKRVIVDLAEKAGVEVCEVRPKDFERSMIVEPYDPKRPRPKWGRRAL